MLVAEGKLQVARSKGETVPPGCLVDREGRPSVEPAAYSDGGSLLYWLGETLKDAEGSFADRDPESHGLTFLALLGGERSPGWHQHARGAIQGMTFATTPLDIRQAALEGVAFTFADTVASFVL